MDWSVFVACASYEDAKFVRRSLLTHPLPVNVVYRGLEWAMARAEDESNDCNALRVSLVLCSPGLLLPHIGATASIEIIRRVADRLGRAKDVDLLLEGVVSNEGRADADGAAKALMVQYGARPTEKCARIAFLRGRAGLIESMFRLCPSESSEHFLRAARAGGASAETTRAVEDLLCTLRADCRLRRAMGGGADT